jgi:hypothetical protein
LFFNLPFSPASGGISGGWDGGDHLSQNEEFMIATVYDSDYFKSLNVLNQLPDIPIHLGAPRF